MSLGNEVDLPARVCGPWTSVAYAVFRHNGTTLTVMESHGISDISRLATGRYTLTLKVKPQAMVAFAGSGNRGVTTTIPLVRLEQQTLNDRTIQVSFRSITPSSFHSSGGVLNDTSTTELHVVVLMRMGT